MYIEKVQLIKNGGKKSVTIIILFNVCDFPDKYDFFFFKQQLSVLNFHY